MSIFSKHSVSVASSKLSKINLSSRVLSTNDIGENICVYSREVVPKDKWHISIDSFSRLAPLPVPTFANIKQVNRVFYVKFQDVWKPWKDFYAGTKFYDSNGVSHDVMSVPFVSNKEIMQAIANDYADTGTAQDNDFYFTVPAGSTGDDILVYYKHTPESRYLVSCLSSLGIKLNFSYDDTTSISLLPILCRLKVHLDYYIPSKYHQTSPIRSLLADMLLDPAGNVNSITTILDMLLESRNYYVDNDYFTSSWKSPTNIGTSASVGRTLIIDNSTDSSSISVSDKYYGYAPSVMQDSSDQKHTLTAQSLHLLESLYNWVTRKNLSGNKYYQQILSQFGLNIPSHDDGRSYFLGSSTSITKIGDVFATAGSQENSLGDFAGKGYNKSETNNIKLDATDFGQIIIISSLVPEIGYVEGRNREVLHLNRLDFFQPEFDFVGMQAVRQDELFAQHQNSNVYEKSLNTGQGANNIFGYHPRYMEYRRPYDNLLGDFFNNTTKFSLSGYHCFRLFDTNDGSVKIRQNTSSFRCSNTFRRNLNRIFQYQGTDAQHFICAFDIKASVKRPMKSASNAFDLDGYETVNINSDNNL